MVTQFIEFSARHSGLLSALAFVTSLLLGFEFYRRAAGSQPLSPAQAVLLMNRKPLLTLDLRGATSFTQGHIKNAKHAPQPLQLTLQLQKWQPEEPILLITEHSCPFAILRLLRSKGFKQLYHLEGGMQAWQQAGLPFAQ